MSDARWMEDYARIARDTGGEIVMPADTLAAHEDHLAWLTGAIRPPHQGWTVIVSHHLPSGSVAGSISPLSPVFASNLEPWILEHRPDLWLCGHSHRHREAWIGTTLIRDISLGYPEEVAEGRAPELLMRGLVDSRASDLLIH